MELMKHNMSVAEEIQSQVQQMFDDGILKAGINGKY